jgi:hypothetical protein
MVLSTHASAQVELARSEKERKGLVEDRQVHFWGSPRVGCRVRRCLRPSLVNCSVTGNPSVSHTQGL